MRDGYHIIPVAVAATAEAPERVSVVGGAYQVLCAWPVGPTRNTNWLDGVQKHAAKLNAGDGGAAQASSRISMGLSKNVNHDPIERASPAVEQIPGRVDGAKLIT